MESDDAVHVLQRSTDALQTYTVGCQQNKGLGACLLEMYNQSLWTDVIFRFKDHAEVATIKAHKTVLAARSQVFQAMFFGPCADKNDQVELEHVTRETFDLFLRYVYSDTVDLSTETVFEILRTAHCYQVSSLVQFCAVFLMNVITTDNACDVLSNAMLYDLTALRDTCCSFIDNHALEVLKSDSFMNLNEKCLLYILKGDTLYADETKILEAVDKWARKKIAENGEEVNGTNVRKYLGECFYQVRIPTMTSESLLRSVSRRGYFSVEEYADISGYINRISGISVSTNSSVGRISETETVQEMLGYCKGEENSLASGENKYTVHDSISSTVQIVVGRDVCLSKIVIGKLCPYETLKKSLYSPFENEYHKQIQSITKKDKEMSRNKLIVQVESIWNEVKGYVLKPIEELELPEYLNLDISGSVTIESLSFKQDFKMQHQDNNVIKIIPELILKKASSPYKLTVVLRYTCGGAIKIGAVPKKNYCGFSAHSREIHTRYVNGFQGAIKSMQFKFFSNRDIKPVLPLKSGTQKVHGICSKKS
ncbi:uncharacterized protein LOC132741914 [Ruditapes philippinarum]|uniref:uncharacterized protein LOC132741914 n=1 Tax=Ruditapes philippinarum TaxID=129788 RepID=UPI00295AE6F7|nr:uncharacterized protein LOC132741914 [Ruditapes philippinarum]